ncbi:MAG: PQQ-dependent sugar dehydrogenase [Actinomycetota bacterium]
MSLTTHPRQMQCLLARLIPLVLAVVAWPAVSAAPARAAVTFHDRPVAVGLRQPVAFTFAPNGRIFYVEKTTGEVHLYNPASDQDRLFVTVPGVDAQGERGTLGIALHPGYPTQPFVYVYATRLVSGVLQNQILRYTAAAGVGTDPRTIFSTPASASAYHNGGRIEFGPDGMLYAVVGDGHGAANAQDLTNPRGKMLRMTPRGRRPADDPIRNSRIFEYGIRNSFGFDFDPVTGDLWETENGPSCNDEVNYMPVGGRNYGWGRRQDCGSLGAPRDTNNSGPRPRILPKMWFVDTIGITGMTFCARCGLTGSNGDLFFGDVNFGQIRRVPLSRGRDSLAGVGRVVFDTGSVLSVESGPDGSIYYSDFSGIYRLRN